METPESLSGKKRPLESVLYNEKPLVSFLRSMGVEFHYPDSDIEDTFNKLKNKKIYPAVLLKMYTTEKLCANGIEEGIAQPIE
jgi:hypothetical protein